MKKRIIIICLFLLGALLAMPLHPHLGKKYTDWDANDGTSTVCDISNWSYWVYSNGMTGHAPCGSGGGIYPREINTQLIYQDGFLWGGLFDTDDDGHGDEVRVGGQQYNIATIPGWVNVGGNYSDGSFSVADPSDPAVRVYNIRKDYLSLTHDDLIMETALRNQVEYWKVNESMTQELIDQYAKDWNEWPVEHGAPYVDHDHDGVFTAGIDEPGYANADQVIWFVANDYSMEKTTSLFGSHPIGIELQGLIWAYDQVDFKLGQSIFKSYTLINKSNRIVEDMYVSQWSDPDIGYAGDDLCGCDTLLDMGFAYNGKNNDNDFDAYDKVPPAVGYTLLQGPMIESLGDTAFTNLTYHFDHKNLGMTSFSLFLPYGFISDPDLGDYSSTLIYYNFMRGFYRDENLANPIPWYVGNDTSNETTVYPLSGDPVLGIGDIDNQANWFPPGDRRIMINSGPFDFAPGDTQEIVFSMIGGHGDNYLSSISEIKKNAQLNQKIYAGRFENVSGAPTGPKVTYQAFETSVLLEWGSDQLSVSESENYAISDYKFEGYTIYQLPSFSCSIDEAYRVATFDLDNDIRVIYDTRVLDSHEGLEAEVPVAYGSDSGIKRYIYIDWDYIHDRPLYEGSRYYYAVSAYCQNLSDDRQGAKVYESDLNCISVLLQEELPGQKLSAYVDQSDFDINHAEGKGEGFVFVKVLDPYKITGDDYTINFDVMSDSSTLLFSIENTSAGTQVSEKNPLILDTLTYSAAPLIDGMEVKVQTVSTGIKSIDEYDENGVIIDSTMSVESGGWGSSWYYLTNPANKINLPFGERDFDRYEVRGTNDLEIDFSDSSVAWQYVNDQCLNEKVPFAIYRKKEACEERERLFIAIHDIGYRDSSVEMGLGVWDTTRNVSSFWSWQYEPIYAYVGPTEYLPSQETAYLNANDLKSPPSSTGMAVSGNPLYYPILTEALFMGISDGDYPKHNKICMQTYNPISTDDEFTFSTAGYEMVDNDSLLHSAIDRMNVFPNPYNRIESINDPSYPSDIVFTHLPESAIIKIYNLAGVLVKTLEHQGGQFMAWDRKNESSIPVASGMYLAHISIPEVAKQKILKVMIVH